MTSLTPDTVAVVSKPLKNTSLALAALQQLLTKDELDADYAKTLLGLVELNMADVSKRIGVPTETQAEVEERFALISAANIRIAELEHQLGEAAQIDSLIHGIKFHEEKFRQWWKTQGFGHTSKFSIDSYGIKATLSGSLSGKLSSIFSDTPVSDKENKVLWLNSLVDKGYVLSGLENKDKREVELIDCDKNRELIVKLITQQFPSAAILSILKLWSPKWSFSNPRHRNYDSRLAPYRQHCQSRWRKGW